MSEPRAGPREGAPDEVDAAVAVVGGGLTGVSALWLLLESGVAPSDLVLLEAGRIAGGATGRSAGMLTLAMPEPYARLEASLGDAARRMVELSVRNRVRLRQWWEELQLGAPWRAGGALLLAARDHEEEELRASVAALRADGFEAEFCDAGEAADRLGAPTSWGGAFDPGALACEPADLVQGMAAACVARGARILESTEILGLESAADGRVRLSMEGGTLRADRVLLATNAFAPRLDPSLTQFIQPTRGQMLRFPALRQRILEPVVARNSGFEYFRQDAAGRFLFGGMRYLAFDREHGYEEALEPRIQERLVEFARELYPALRGLEPERRWSGIMGFSCDGLPLVGPHPHRSGVVLCLGFSGHGLGLAAEAARIAVELIVEGQSADADLFSPRRML